MKVTQLGGEPEESDFGTLSPYQMARVVHQAIREVQFINGEEVSPEWDEAPQWMKTSTEDGVQLALQGATPRELHEEWMTQRLAQGWVYGPVKLDEGPGTPDAPGRRENPALVPYEQLPLIQKLKDAVVRNIVLALSSIDNDGDGHPDLAPTASVEPTEGGKAAVPPTLEPAADAPVEDA